MHASAAVTAAAAPPRPVHMVGPWADGLLLSGGLWMPALLAIAIAQPDAPTWAYWLLAFAVFDPHIATTWIRLYGDPAERRTHRGLAFGLPVAILGVLGVAALLVPPGALGLALYGWQWWHTVRQSYGVLRTYQGRRGTIGSVQAKLEVAALWAVPVAALLFQLRLDADDYLGFAKPGLPIPQPLLSAALALALSVVLAAAVGAVVRRLRGGELPGAELVLLGGTAAFFGTGALILEDLFWDNVLLSLYHSTQYVAFAALFQRRKAAGPGFEGGLVRWIGSPWRWARYLAVLLALGAAYAAVVRWLLPEVLPILALAVAEWTIRLHHYMVDARIWKLRKTPGVAQVLGVRPA